MNFNSTFPSPRVKVTSKQGAMPGIEIRTMASDLLIQNDETKPNCDSMSRSKIAATIEYLRMEDVCAVKIDGGRSVTSNEGYATFDQFKIRSGPQGTYSFVFATPLSEIASEEYQIFLRSNASHIVVLSSLPVSQPVGVPFQVQPKVMVYDEGGKGLPDARVVAFSWPESKFSGSQVPYLTQPHRFAWLEGNEAFTDSTGQATFKDLTVYGANSDSIYIFFAVNGVVVQQWGIQQPYYASLIDVQAYYSYPLMLTTPSKYTLQITQSQDEIIENEFFQTPIRVKVTNELGNPVPNQMVFARIIMAGGNIYPLGYEPYVRGQLNKQLLYPTPGVYSVSINNPLSEYQIVFPILTDNNGEVQFTDMKFSQEGVAGDYQIRFECLSFFVDSNIIHVKTSVASIDFFQEPLSYMNLLEYSIENKLNPIIQVLDQNGKGVKGKTALIELYPEDGTTPLDQKIIDMRLATFSDKFEPTNEQGFSKLVFSLQFMQDTQLTFTIKATVDGISVVSRSVTLVKGQEYKQQVGTLILISPLVPIKVIEIDIEYEYQFQLLDSNGLPYPSQDVYLTFNYVGDTPTQFPQQVFPSSLANANKMITDANGIAKFTIKLNQGATGTIQFQAVAFTKLDPTFNDALLVKMLTTQTTSKDQFDEYILTIQDASQNKQVKICYSQDVSLPIKAKLQEIKILQVKKVQGQSATTMSNNFLTFNQNSFQENVVYTYFDDASPNSFSYNIYAQLLIDHKGTPLALTTIQVGQPIIITKPTYLWGRVNADFITSSAISTPQTDSNGQIIINIKIKRGYIGAYAISFFIQGSYSQAVVFTAKDYGQEDFTKFSLQINQKLTQQTTPQDVGKYLNSGQVTVYYNGQVVPSAQVIASIYQTNLNTFLDLTDLGAGADPMAVFAESLRLVESDSMGVAKYTKLSVTEVLKDQNSVSFKVYVGQSDNFYFKGMSVSNDFSDVLQFKQNKLVEISNKQYSTRISQGYAFPVPVKIKVTKTTLTDYDQFGLMVYAAVPFKVDAFEPPNPYDSAPLYLDNFICAYNEKKALKTFSTCTPEINIQGTDPGPYVYEIEFKSLKWIYSSSQTKFQLSISDPLNYVKKVGDKFPSQAYSAETTDIEVSNTPAIIEITTQPSALVTVGDMFPVSVKVKISSGLPVLRATVQAFITPDPGSTKKATLSELKDLIFTLASGNVDAKSIGGLTKKSNVMLEKASSSKKTNRKGEAQFNLKVLTGLPGNYTLTFQSGSAKSDRSLTFELANRIKEINITKQVEVNVYKNEETEFIKFSNQPELKVKFANDLPFLGEKIIEIRVYQWVDPVELQKALDQTQQDVKKSMEVMIDQYNNQDQQLKASAYDTMKNTWNAILNGGKIIKAVDKNAENVRVQFSYPEELLDGRMVFKDLSIEWKNYGKYMLVFVINGIESIASDPFEVAQSPPTIENYFVSAFEVILIVSTVVAILLGITAQNNSLWMGLGLSVSIATLGLVTLSRNPLVWKILVWITDSLMVAILIYVFIIILLKLCRKNGKYTLPFEIKYMLFAEYTFQLIYSKPSPQWVDYKQNNGQYVLPYKTEKSQPQIEDINSIPESDLNEKEEENLVLKAKKEEENLGVIKKFIKCFIPFETANNKLIVGNCLYYPQRIFAGSLLSVVSVAYIAYQAFQITSKIEGWIDSLNAQIRSANFIFMYGSLNAMIVTFSDSPFPEDTFQKSQEAVDFITKQMTLLGQALTISFSISTTLSCLIYFFAFFVLIYDFRFRILNLRKGVYDFIEARIAFPDSTNYIGTQVANSAVSFIIVLFFLGIIFTVLCHPLFWQFLYENIYLILGLLLSTSIFLKIAQIIAIKVLIDPIQGIKYRRLWSIFELFMLYVAIAGGLLSALSRIIMLIVLSLVGLARLDQSLFPEWINEVIYLDAANKIYLSMLYIYHCHNHPVAVTTFQYFVRDVLELEQKQEENKKSPEQTKKQNELGVIDVAVENQKQSDLTKVHDIVEEVKQSEINENKNINEDGSKKKLTRGQIKIKLNVLSMKLNNQLLIKKKEEQKNQNETSQELIKDKEDEGKKDEVKKVQIQKEESKEMSQDPQVDEENIYIPKIPFTETEEQRRKRENEEL